MDYMDMVPLLNINKYQSIIVVYTIRQINPHFYSDFGIFSNNCPVQGGTSSCLFRRVFVLCRYVDQI